MYKQQLNIKDKFESYCLSFNTKELLEQVGKDVVEPNSFLVEGRRVWLKDEKPVLLKEIDQQLRKIFNIGKNKVAISLYYPPEGKEKSTIVKESKKNILTRFIISTITENPEVSYGSIGGQKVEFKSWNAYKCPDVVGSSLNYEFSNSNIYSTEAKKGFRKMRRTKSVKDRYILVFDYIICKNDLSVLSKQLEPLAEKANISQDEIEKAINSLEI